MKTLEEVKGACRIAAGGHWIFASGRNSVRPRIQAPDFTVDPTGNTRTIQQGRRAVWHIHTGQPIPAGHLICSQCFVPGCIRPECLLCLTPLERGALVRSTGRYRGTMDRKLANRRGNLSKRKVTDALAAEILASPESIKDLAARLQLHRNTVSRCRRGIIASVPNMFAGLMV